MRNIQDAIHNANDDMKTKTALIESRLITGDATLFGQFQQRLEARCIRNHVDAHLQMRISAPDARRVKFGDSAPLQAPNTHYSIPDYQVLIQKQLLRNCVH